LQRRPQNIRDGAVFIDQFSHAPRATPILSLHFTTRTPQNPLSHSNARDQFAG